MSVTLYHGDCLEVMPTLADGSVDMVLCDLPYGTTACKWDVVIPFAPLWEQYRRIVKRNGAIVLFGSQPFTSLLITSNLPMFRYQWVWDKAAPSNPRNARHQPLRVCEDVVVFRQAAGTYNPQLRRRERKNMRWTDGTHSQNSEVYGRTAPLKYNSRRVIPVEMGYPLNLISISAVGHNNRNRHHPTQKPVALCEYLIRTYTNEGEVVLDNTMGVGTTGVACVNTGRAFVGIEKDAQYFEIAQRRIEAAQVAPRQLELVS